MSALNFLFEKINPNKAKLKETKQNKTHTQKKNNNNNNKKKKKKKKKQQKKKQTITVSWSSQKFVLRTIGVNNPGHVRGMTGKFVDTSAIRKSNALLKKRFA